MTSAVNVAQAVPCAASIDFDTAQAILAAHARRLGSEAVRLGNAGGRRLAAPVFARFDAPHRDCAAMDGYAVRDDDLNSGVVRFRALGTSCAGDCDAGEIGPGETQRVMTGAPLPLGADRVVMIEQCGRAGNQVWIEGASFGKSHVRRKGSDFASGDLILAEGQRMTPAALVAAAAADQASLMVARKPGILLLATGDELVAPGMATAGAHMVPDSLGDAIGYLCVSAGAEVVAEYRLPDETGAIAAARSQASADVVVVIGGASRGDRDFGRSAFAAEGLKIAFADVAIKPGKPVWYGRLGATHLLGLPGNPTAALTTARLFLVPLIAGLSGAATGGGLSWQLRPAATAIPPNGPREAFLCGRSSYEGVMLCDRQEASAQAMLAAADCLVRRPAHAPALPAGALLPAISLC